MFGRWRVLGPGGGQERAATNGRSQQTLDISFLICSYCGMVPALPTTPADRFALIIDGLCRVVAAQHARGLAGPMIILIWTRLRRAGARFASLLARFEAGTLPASAPPRRRTARRSCALPADPGDDGRGAEMDRGSPPQGGCS